MYAATESKLSPGGGRIILGGKALSPKFTDLEFSYPLKLIVPSRHFIDRLACLYMITYGGGLLAGDKVEIAVEVRDGCALVLLTQGSTKVFQSRIGIYKTNPSAAIASTGDSIPTLQILKVEISPLSSLFLLPSPVTCFSQAKYHQSQIFHLSTNSNLLLLDWYTSGRMGMKSSTINNGLAEEWAFSHYESSNEIYIDNKRLVNDVLRLSDDSPPGATETSYRNLVEPYSCYATLFLFGPSLLPLLAYFNESFNRILQYKLNNPYDLIWSFSELEGGKGGKGGVVRCAGVSTERVRDWFVEVLEAGGIVDLLGRDLWATAL